jgi:hypothetical protein
MPRVLLPAHRGATDVLSWWACSVQLDSVSRAILQLTCAGAALYVLATITAARLLQLKFIEQVRLVGASLVVFVTLITLSGMPDRGYVCGWLSLGAIFLMIGVHANEKNRRLAFADNEATRYACECRCGGGLFFARAKSSWRRSASHQQSIELVHAMLPAHITQAMRDGASLR